MESIFAALKALNDSAAPEAPARPPAPKAAAPAPTPAVPPPKQPARTPARRTGLLQGMFEDGNSLLRAIVAAEVLSPPPGLREPALWNQQPNEPSI